MPLGAGAGDASRLLLALAAAAAAVTAAHARTPLEAFRPPSPPPPPPPTPLAAALHFERPEPPTPPRRAALRILYQTGDAEAQLAACQARQVCSKVDLYDSSQPWLERKCRCSGHRPCSRSLSDDDNHSLVDKTSLYKTCEPVRRLPKCRYFKDAAWTIFSSPDTNATRQLVNCRCPKLSVAYLLRKHATTTSSGQLAHQYQFACSPISRLRCSRKEPCKLFSVRRRREHIDEVVASAVCTCPRAHACPRRHTEPAVLPGLVYPAEEIRTYHGYCLPDAETAATDVAASADPRRL